MQNWRNQDKFKFILIQIFYLTTFRWINNFKVSPSLPFSSKKILNQLYLFLFYIFLFYFFLNSASLLAISTAAVKPTSEEALQKKTDVLLQVLKYGTSLERKAALVEVEKLPEDKKIVFKTILLDGIPKEKEPTMKQALIRTIGELKILEAKTILETSLLDPNEDVARASVQALKKIDSPDSWKAILERLKTEDLTKNSNLSITLITSLSEIAGGENAKDFLEAKLKEKFNSPEVRAYAALYFGKKKIITAETFLQEIAFNDNETVTLRTYSINSLGKIGSQSSIPKLKELIDEIRKDPSKDSKKNQLLKIYSLGALITLGDEKAFDEIVEFTKDDDSIVRLRSIQFLLESKRPEVREILEYKSKRDPSPKVQKSAADALKKLDEGKPLESIEEIVEDKKDLNEKRPDLNGKKEDQ